MTDRADCIQDQDIKNLEYLNDCILSGTSYVQSRLKQIEKRLAEMNKALEVYKELSCENERI